MAVSDWVPSVGGTYSWTTPTNWTGGVPNSIGAIVDLNNDISGNQIIQLNAAITLGIINFGDPTPDSTGARHTMTVEAGTGGSLIFDNGGSPTTTGFAIQLNKAQATTDTISAPIDVNGRLAAAISAGTMVLSGGLVVGGPNLEETLEKTGGGTLTISGNLTVTNDAGISSDQTKAVFINGGTTNISGPGNTISDGFSVSSGTVNFGSAAISSSTTFTTGQGKLVLEGTGGTVNFGVNSTAANVNTNVSIDIDRIQVLAGTLNLRNTAYGTGGSGTVGSTTLNFGSTGTLTLDAGTTTLARTDGSALGDVIFPANAKLVLNNNAVFNFTDNVANNATLNGSTTSGTNVVVITDTTGLKVGDSVTGTNIPANAIVVAISPNVSITLSVNSSATGAITDLRAFSNTNLVGLNSASNTSVLRSQAGSGTLMIGGDGVADVFNGQLNFASSAANSRLIKVGTEDLTLGGTLDNSSSRLEIRTGTAVLAKSSSPTIHAIGSTLIIGESTTSPVDLVDPAVESAKIGGSYVGTGSTMGQANFRDQISRGVGVVVNPGAVLDLAGNMEGFNTLSGTGSVQSSVAGGTLLLGENNPGASTFAGTLFNGGGQLSLWKGGTSDLTLTGNNTFTGETLSGRANLILSGANGALSGTNAVWVTRFATLRLDNNASINNNRINDTAAINLDSGEIRMVRNSTAGVSGNTSETVGALNLSNYNIIRMDHTNVGAGSSTVANVMVLNFASYNRNPGGTVSIFDQVASQFTATNPDTANSRVTLATLPSSTNLAGTTSASNAAAVDTKVLVGAWGGTGGGGPSEFMTVQTVSGVNYIRPLQTGDYNSAVTGTLAATNIPATGTALGTADDNIRTSGGITLGSNQGFNAWRQTSSAGVTSTTTIGDCYTLYLGSLGATSLNVALDGSGMVYLTGPTGGGAITIQGGSLAFGNREGIVRTDAGRVNTVQTATLGNNSTIVTNVDSSGMGIGDRVTGTNIAGNAEIIQIIENGAGAVDTIILNVPSQQSGAIVDLSVFPNTRIDSRITGSGGLTKTGGNTLELASASTYSGLTVVGEGDLRVFDDKALGQGGAGNGTRIAAGRTLTLNSGVNIRDEALDLLGNATLQNMDRNNNWQGNITINPTDAAGQNVNMTFRTQNNGALTINGTVTTPSTNRALGYYEVDPAYNAEGESQQFILENYGGKGGIMSFNGRISDHAGTEAAAGALHDELNIVIRGYTGQSVTTNSDFAVNLADVSAVNGRLDLRSGFVTIGSDYGGASSAATRGATIRLTDGGNVDRAGSIAALLMTTPGTTFRGAQINVGENTGSYSSKSTTLVGGLANSGVITFGSDSGSIDMNPIAGSTSFTSSTTNANAVPTINSVDDTASGVNAITLSDASSLSPGDGISGSGIPANTRIDAIVGNTIYLTKNTSAAFDAGTTYTFYSPIANQLTFSSVAGLKVGMGISGTGIAPGSIVTSISGTTLTLSAPLIDYVPTNTAYSFPLANASYQTINRAVAGQPNSSGQAIVQLFSVTGLTPGTIVSGTGIPSSTTILSIDPANDQVTLSNNLTTNIANVALTFQKASNFAETRVYAPSGGTVDFQMRLLDDGGFSLNNEVGALTKVGKGTVQMSGSAAGGGDIDGGVNLFGGTLVFDYGPLRANTRVSSAGATLPYQLTLAGGDLVIQDDEFRNTVENLRGTLTVRAGNSQIIGRGGNASKVTLNLGYVNDFSAVDLNSLSDPYGSLLYWRDPSRFAGGTIGFFYDTSIGGTAEFDYSQNAPDFIAADFNGTLGVGSIIPYSSFKMTLFTTYVDFASFQRGVTLASNGSSTLFADAEGGLTGSTPLYDPNAIGSAKNLAQWANLVDGIDVLHGDFIGNRGYMTDGFINDATPFTGTLAANSGADFVGARVVRFASDAANNTLTIGNGVRLVLGTNGDDAYIPVGTAVVDGGAILISNVVSTSAAHDQTIKGGSLTSALASTYFSASVMPGPYTKDPVPAATSTDLIILNYNPSGIVNIESSIVNYQALPLNLVLSGPGTTHVNPTTSNTYTGVTYINDGTLWVSDGSRFGNGTGGIYMNGGTLEFASDTPAGRTSTPITATLASSRQIELGGDGGAVKISAPGSVLTYGGTIRAEDNILPLNLSENQIEENLGVGDFTKLGTGRLILTNGVATGSSGWNAYYGLTEVNEGALQLNINVVNSGILGSSYTSLDRTIVRSGARLDLEITGGSGNGTEEWIELAGGTLGTTGSHVDGTLDGVITVSTSSKVDIVGAGNLRMNSNAGYVVGTGALTKTGSGTLFMTENNPNFSGDWTITQGRVVGRSQGLPFGAGALLSLGDTGPAASGTAEIFLESRTTAIDFNTEYIVTQNLVVNAEGGGSQVKTIGARNFDDSVASGEQWDRYAYKGSIALNDDLVLAYGDNILNTSKITGTGADRIIALDGVVSGVGNMQTTINFAGDTPVLNSNDLRIYFEVNGDNSAWTGDLTLGNTAAADGDASHIVRLGRSTALTAAVDVTQYYNSKLQVAGNAVTIGNLFVAPGGIASGTGASANGIIVENASFLPGTISISQTVDENWDILFQNGVTPTIYCDGIVQTPNNTLGVTKLGAATATLTQANTYTGATAVGSANGSSGGRLSLGTGGAISASSPLFVYAGTFENNNGGNQNYNAGVTLGGGASGTNAVLTSSGAAINTLGSNVVYDATNNPGGATISGKLALGIATRTFTVGDSSGADADLTVTADVSGSGGITKAGAGTMVLSGTASSYSGATLVNAGVLRITTAAALGTTAGITTVSSGAALEMDGSAGAFTNSEPLTISGTGISNGGALRNIAGANTLNGAVTLAANTSIGADGASRLTIGSVVNDGASSFSVTKVGTGTLALTNANTYDGGTTISGGTLAANNTTGSATGTGAVTVASGAALAGTGIITPASGNGVTIGAGGSLIVGDPAGTSADDLVINLTGTANFTLNGTAEFQIFADLAGTPGVTENDLLKINASNWSNIIFGTSPKPTIKVTSPLDSTTWAVGDTWRLFDWLGITTGTVPAVSVATYDLPTLGAGKGWDTSTIFSAGTISIVNVVPEPGRASLLAVACAAGLLRRRRRA